MMMDSLLSETSTDALYNQLLLEQNSELATDELTSQVPLQPSKAVVPKPGFCLKTKTDKDEKVFINICQSQSLPAPKDISDEELVALLDSDESSGFRVPMSLGEPRAELDKSGNGCIAYDVIVNSEFYQSVTNRHMLLGFVLTLVLEGLEHKYDMTLDRKWRMLKNRKFVGMLPEQNVRSKSKPLIMEMNGDGNKPLIQEVGQKDEHVKTRAATQPSFTIQQEPTEGHPEFLVAEVHMPKVKCASSLTLDVGEDRVVMSTRSNVYSLNFFLPYNLIQQDCGAQFNRETQVLTITMPVQV